MDVSKVPGTTPRARARTSRSPTRTSTHICFTNCYSSPHYPRPPASPPRRVLLSAPPTCARQPFPWPTLTPHEMRHRRVLTTACRAGSHRAATLDHAGAPLETFPRVNMEKPVLSMLTCRRRGGRDGNMEKPGFSMLAPETWTQHVEMLPCANMDQKLLLLLLLLLLRTTTSLLLL